MLCCEVDLVFALLSAWLADFSLTLDKKIGLI